MTTFSIREPNKVFTDRIKFPYGFKKSGDFSITEAELLGRYGHTLMALEQGSLSPDGADEHQFMAVIKGHTPPANTLEKAWLKYVRLTRQYRPFFTLNSTSKIQYFDDATENEDYDIAG